VRVTAPAYTGSTRIATALAGFAAAHPAIAVELDATNAIRDLVEDSFDFGIRLGPYLHPDFVARKLSDGQFALFAAKTFVERALAGKSRIGKDKLEREPCIVLRTGAQWQFRGRDGGRIAISPRARFAVNDPRAAVNVARLGIGIALVPVDAVSRADRDLVQLQADFGAPEPIALYVVYPTRRLLPRRVRLAIDWLLQAEGESKDRRP
jgi:DNA-binding transcriptional LysR family regulator